MRRFFTIFLVLSLLFIFPTQAICSDKILSLKAVKEKPVNLGEYITTQVDFLAELFTKFVQTAKPNVNFQDKAYGGLQITIWESKPKSIWERPEWGLIIGKMLKYEDIKLSEQPTFYGIEFRGLPLLSDVAEIFNKADLQLLFSEENFYLGLSYEFRENRD